MPSYYGVIRSSEYLTHYGVKGMKWGVRRALERGSDRALARQYQKAERKLQKLTKLGVNKQKYARRAALYGAGAAALGGAALAGASGVGTAAQRILSKRAAGMSRTASLLGKLGRKNPILSGTTEGKRLAEFADRLQSKAGKANTNAFEIRNAIQNYGKSDSIGKRLAPDFIKRTTTVNGRTMTTYQKTNNSNSALRKITNDQYLRGVAALGAAGLGAAAARNAYRAATANRNIIKAAKWKAEMDRTFAGTKYANGVPATKRRRKSRR